MPTCPNGHQSESDDWCDECGLRISMSTAVPAPPPVAPAPRLGAPAPPPFNPAFPNSAPGQPCPNCGTPREGMAAFCEECQYNFLTLPPLPPTGRPPGPPLSSAPPFPLPVPPFPPLTEREGSRPSRVNRPAEPLSPAATITGVSTTGHPPTVSPSATPGPPPGDESGDFLLPPPTTGHTPTAEQSQLPPNPRPVHPVHPVRPVVPVRPVPDVWTAVVAADRQYFTSMMARSGPEATGLFFPQYSPELLVPLTESQITIGRRRHTTGEAPVIDLSRPPEDPGVSHRHAVLVRRPDGGWSVIDQDSTNGTTVNDGADPIAPFQPVELNPGDRVHVGAWTTITLRRG